MNERTCSACRFGEPLAMGLAQCRWVDRTEDEAGDRMPLWAYNECISAIGRGAALLDADHAEACPAFEAQAS